ncbi:metallophosphoesterase [Carboxylicivirga sp. RSCT41]|uniref:metallophosphoesterase n=1 Tax=Carboxylicivirga agarovorans TaxID=3417570 RepID=UPI003D32F74A
MRKVSFIVFFILILGCNCNVVTASIASVANDSLPIPAAQWNFDDADNLTKAALGDDLVLKGKQQSIAGPTNDNRAVRIGPGSYYIVKHNLRPKANESYVNTYSILFDLRINGIENWHSLLQTNTENDEDAELYIRYPQGTFGYSATKYSYTKVGINVWYRLIMVVDNGTEYSLYLDGKKILSGKVQEVDSNYSLRPELLLFVDNKNQDDWIDIAQVSLYNKALTEKDIEAIGPLKLSPNPIITQPWFQNVTTSGITVMWESKVPEPGTLYYGSTEEYGKKTTSEVVKTNANTYIHKAVVDDANPASSYYCYADVNGFSSDKRRFTTAPSSPDEQFNVALWSDSHYSFPWSKMAAFIVDSIQPNFAFNAGDISNYGNYRYDLGTVFLPYICGTLGSEVPFYTTFGNHDVGERWGGGDLIRQYHDLPKQFNSDPNAFSGSYLMMYSNVAFISIDWDRMQQDLEPGGWLETVLRSDQVQNARLRFVFIHCAPYYERWQKAELPEVKEQLPTIVEKYNVAAVFSGHMHGYERGEKGGVQYITIGGGSYMDVKEPVGPVIYDHIVRGTDKEDNPEDFNNGLNNNLLTLEVEGSKAIIKLHYFNPKGLYQGVIEAILVGE